MPDPRTGTTNPSPSSVRATPTPVPPPGKPFTTRVRNWFLMFLLLVIVAAGLYILFALKFSYSSGDRAGIVQEFSNKGWVCKTWEGTLTLTTLPGALPQTFAFTVRDDAVAREISALMGQPVVLTYEQHFGLPSCFGDTSYFVTSARVNTNPPAAPGTPPLVPPVR